MTRSDLIHKWLTYALGMFPIWLLDAYILPRYPIHGVTPMLLPLAVVSVAVLEGAYAGVGFGMSVGLLWALSYPGGAGGLVIGMALTGLATGAVSQYVLNQSYPGCLVCSAGALAALDGVRILGWLVTERATLPAMLRVAGPEILLSLAWSPVVWLIFRSVYRRVGGSRLA
jgi:rod shape-determining protein MreD